MTMPSCSATGNFNTYSVPITVPAGTATGVYSVIGKTTVTYSDGLTLTQSGDTVVCLVPPVPGQPGVPRLNLTLLSESFPRAASGDQRLVRYQVTNNDPTQSVTLTAFATSKQIAVRPQGANEKQGVFSIANPFGDDFPIIFDPSSCITLPNHPFTQPEIMKPLPPINPGQSTIIQVGIRSYGQCASGSCSESTLRVTGTFSDGSPAMGCAGMALYADTSMPTQSCLPRVDDCNGNGIPDALDIANGTSHDQNFNAMPDECVEDRGAPLIPNPVQVNPPVSTVPIELVSLNLQSVCPIQTCPQVTN